MRAVIDYLDKPPQRYTCYGKDDFGHPYDALASEDSDGAWVRFDDMDLYMLEGFQMMRELAMRLQFAETLLLRTGINEPLFQEYAGRYPIPMQWPTSNPEAK